jgi:fatty-acyl-CoA synthase
MASVAQSYLHGASPVPLLGETIGRNLDRTVAAFGDHDAVISVHQGIRQTYAQFAESVTEIARGLLALGIEPGDRVGIWSPNTAEWVTLQYATAKVGAILVNVNPAYRTSELAYALRQSGVSTLVLAPRFRQADYLAMLDEVAGDLPALRQRIVLGSEAPSGAMSWDELRERAAGATADQVRAREELLQFDDPINIQYTSGTTGFPKGATLSHHNILNNGFFIGEGCRYTEADRVCFPVPLYHCFGMVLGNLACTTHGAAIVYPSESLSRTSASSRSAQSCRTSSSTATESAPRNSRASSRSFTPDCFKA